MGLSVCPIAVIAAPVELVWANIAQWEHYPDWADVHAEHVEPEGPASAGQTVSFAGEAFGRTMRFTFKILEVDPQRHRLALHAFFPFGLQEIPHIACDPIDAVSCRVTYG